MVFVGVGTDCFGRLGISSLLERVSEDVAIVEVPAYWQFLLEICIESAVSGEHCEYPLCLLLVFDLVLVRFRGAILVVVLLFIGLPIFLLASFELQVLFPVFDFGQSFFSTFELEFVNIVEYLDHPIQVLFLMQIQDNIVAGFFIRTLFGFVKLECQFIRRGFCEDAVDFGAEQLYVVPARVGQSEGLFEQQFLLGISCVEFVLAFEGSSDALLERNVEFLDDFESQSSHEGCFDVIEDVEDGFRYLQFVFEGQFPSHVDFQFAQEEQHSFHEEVIFPSFAGDVVVADFLAEEGEQLRVGVFADEGALEQSVRKVDEVFVVVGEVLEGEEVEDHV